VFPESAKLRNDGLRAFVGRARMTLSIVIPTRDRGETLERTLAAVAARLAETPALEVVVVENGGIATKPAVPSALAENGRLRIERLPPPAAGPAAARNLGIRLARGERILLLGDDTAPAVGCLAAHAGAVDGMQGRIEWDPSRPVTDLMRFLAPRGPQFWFSGLVDGGEIPFTALLGSNYSAPRDWFLTEPFDESFPDAAFEDTELAWRFRERGFKSRYCAGAVALHDHPYDEIEPFLARQRRAGRSARSAVRRHPALLWWALLRPLGMHAAKALLPSRRDEPERSWDRDSRRAYLAGFLGMATKAR